MIDIFDAVTICMGYKTNFKGSTAELRYLEDFEDGFLDLWLSASLMMKSAQSEQTLIDYLNSNSTFLLL